MYGDGNGGGGGGGNGGDGTYCLPSNVSYLSTNGNHDLRHIKKTLSSPLIFAHVYIYILIKF